MINMDFRWMGAGMVALLAGCGGASHDHPHDGDHGDDTASPSAISPFSAPPAGVSAAAVVMGREGVEIGRALLTEGPNGVIARIDATGLEEGFHGIHLHQVGDCSDHEAGFKASGSHVNPTGKMHGLLHPEGFELADLPNVYAAPSGHVRAELFVAGLSLDTVMDDDGFAMVVHENEDDHVTQPIGNAGPRVACVAFR